MSDTLSRLAALTSMERQTPLLAEASHHNLSSPVENGNMGLNSGIEWTEATWNPVTGCDKISPGCKHCYAERMARRLKAMGQRNYVNGFELTLQEHAVELPLKWKKPQRIFVNSMSDLFHEEVPVAFIQRVFAVMKEAHWHRFQVLTKRSARLAELSPHLEWPGNVWMGVSIESDKYCHRADDLRSTDAQIKFLSLEPLLGPLTSINLHGIDWAIIGGESGPGARLMKSSWVENIMTACRSSGTAFFFKQVGSNHEGWDGITGKGGDPDEWPTFLRVREMPDHLSKLGFTILAS